MDLGRFKEEIAWRVDKRVKTLGGVETKDMQGVIEHLDAMIAANKKLLSAIEQIADPASPFDKTGEPLQVRIAKDLTRRIEIAQGAL